MHRLLQGDVGSGKTVVAVTALLSAVEGPSGCADGSHRGPRRTALGLRPRDSSPTSAVPDPGNLFGDRPLAPSCSPIKVTGNARKQLLADLAVGGVDIVIGTHALIKTAVDFHRLGVVVVDEQHRFGVEQRAPSATRPARAFPTCLVMTATPIPAHGGDDRLRRPRRQRPRRAAAGPHADRDDQRRRAPLDQELAWDAVRTEVAAGHQAYVVCPLIEDSEKLEAASAEETFPPRRRRVARALRLGSPPRTDAACREEDVMERFRDGPARRPRRHDRDRGGVDVPNATVMVILDADRFGIAQLHQLRGRVGRRLRQVAVLAAVHERAEA